MPVIAFVALWCFYKSVPTETTDQLSNLWRGAPVSEIVERLGPPNEEEHHGATVSAYWRIDWKWRPGGWGHISQETKCTLGIRSESGAILNVFVTGDTTRCAKYLRALKKR